MGRFGIVASLGQTAWAARRQWRQLPSQDRERLRSLMSLSGGRPSNLSPAERQELLRLLGELNLGQVLRTSVARTSRRGFRQRRF